MMQTDEDTQKISEFISFELLRIGAVKLQPEKPFKWASGWNSPIYCDNRFTLSFPEVRNTIKMELSKLVSKQFPLAEAIVGVATAGIPQGMLIADRLALPFLYVRPKPKEHGMANLIEGRITPGQKVVVVEDLISTGGSSLKAVDALRNAGVEVLGMVAIFSYGFPLAEESFSSYGLSLYTLSNYETLIQTGIKNHYIPSSALNSLLEWRKDPAGWNASF
jgi:orotate phosphoribosyltransferase